MILASASSTVPAPGHPHLEMHLQLAELRLLQLQAAQFLGELWVPWSPPKKTTERRSWQRLITRSICYTGYTYHYSNDLMHHYIWCRCYYVYLCVCHEISDIPRFRKTSTIFKDVAHQFAPWEVPPSCPGRRKGQALKPWSRQREPWKWQFQWENVIKKTRET